MTRTEWRYVTIFVNAHDYPPDGSPAWYARAVYDLGLQRNDELPYYSVMRKQYPVVHRHRLRNSAKPHPFFL